MGLTRTLPRSVAEVDRLVKDNKGLVEYEVNRYLSKYPVHGTERDDLVSWGMLGLFNAARAWDSKRGIAFSTLACCAIGREIRRGVELETRENSRLGPISLDQAIDPLDLDGHRRIDLLPDPRASQMLDSVEYRALLGGALEALSQPHYALIVRCHYQEEICADIAKEQGVSRQAVQKRLSLARKQLQEYLLAL